MDNHRVFKAMIRVMRVVCRRETRGDIEAKETFDPFELQNYIEIPPELEDICEEISAFIKESRYTDATDLLLKAKRDVDEIFTLVRRCAV